MKKVRSLIENLNVFDATRKESDYITVTEWANGEGWDFSINENTFSLTWGELEAINYMVKSLEYGNFSNN